MCRSLPLCRPSHALYFAAYEASKEAFGGNQPGHQVVATGAAGVIATLVNDTIMTPVDVVKQRLQVQLPGSLTRLCAVPPCSAARSLCTCGVVQVSHTPYTGIWDCVTRVQRTEGLRAFYKAYSTTVRASAAALAPQT